MGEVGITLTVLMFRRLIGWVVDAASRFPLVVLGLTLAALAGSWAYASKLELRSDLLELLPRDSPGFIAFEHQLGRVGGGATLIVVVESPDRAANERFIDDLASKVRPLAGQPGSYVSYVEAGTKDVRAFYESNKWLYADRTDLEDADRTLDRQIALQSGMVEDLLDEAPAPSPSAAATPTPSPAPTAPPSGSAAPAPDKEKKPALGMDGYRERWKKRASEKDDFPTGYFATTDGTRMAIRIVSSTGLGDAHGEQVLHAVRAIVDELQPASRHPAMKVGLAGDIPVAAGEKASLITEAAAVTAIAMALILLGIVFFFRSILCLVIIALPLFVGVAAAYAFATATFGYVNTSGAFLGAIIFGNGVNYPVVLLARYREFVGRGMPRDVARREAVFNAFRAELVGAAVAAIAYGSLTVTRFRGFSQFGMIGFVGMLLVWLSIIPLVPALLVLAERVRPRLPAFFGDVSQGVSSDGSSGPVVRFLATITERWPWVFVIFGIAIGGYAASKLPRYLSDPWEYDFGKLGSRETHGKNSAGEWSTKAEEVFGGKMNIAGALILADTPAQVPLVKAKILENGRSDPQGNLIHDVVTVDDLLPGTEGAQEEKLQVLTRIRERLTPAVLHAMDAGERARVEEIIPPETLRVLTAQDLPPLLKRRFMENNGTVGTVFYVKFTNETSLSDGRNQLRIAKACDNVVLPDGTLVRTASRSTIFAEMIRSMKRDAPLASAVSLGSVALVVILATANLRGAFAVLISLLLGVICLHGGGAIFGERFNYINFIALPITFGIGSEYPFNLYDRSRLLGGDIALAVRRAGGAVILCSYTTIVGYGSLIYSDFQALESFGRLAANGEIACLFAALLFMPSVLHLMRRRRPPPPEL